ncbi:aldehyde ferredoxin oxidoreductase C-terminal domain-containing protein [Chloroflexota bacterium]
MNPLGHSCDVRDMAAVAHLTRMCNEHGMDTMEIGMGLSFLMELWERGIITGEDVGSWTGGEVLSLEWGNYRAMERLIDAAALRQNMLGDILGEGVYGMAVRIGGLKGVDILKYASYGKAGAPMRGRPGPGPSSALPAPWHLSALIT